MTLSDAENFARGMFGPLGVVEIEDRQNCVIGDVFVIGFLENDLFVTLGRGRTWEEAADDCVHEAELSATSGAGPWECPF